MGKFDSETGRAGGKKSTREGVPNKNTKEIREAYKEFVENNLQKFQEWIDRVAETNPSNT